MKLGGRRGEAAAPINTKESSMNEYAERLRYRIAARVMAQFCESCL
jgi:hypothetical protein